MSIRDAFGVNRRYSDHLKLARHDDCVVITFAKSRLLLVRKRAALESRAPRYAKFVFATGSHAVILVWWVRVKFSLGVRVSGMIRVRVDVRVRVRGCNLLVSD